jgi:hypothetical protein
MNHKHEDLWPFKKCMLYTLCILILSNPFHLTIGSNLTLIQNEFWVPKSCHAHFILFFLCFGFPKNAINISAYCIPIMHVIYHFVGWKVVHLYCAFTLLCKIASFAPTKILTLIRWLKQHFKYFYNELKLKKFNKKIVPTIQ